uniref:Uncharacterized protein n=1 Tax=Arundo donax TaxID=35708 RepID=A0A0A9F288_ARUDO
MTRKDGLDWFQKLRGRQQRLLHGLSSCLTHVSEPKSCKNHTARHDKNLSCMV